MEHCEINCSNTTRESIKLNFMDRLLGRSVEEKLANICHLTCLKSEGIKNVKRNGRWGFRHVFGMTEFFSSLFALICFLVHTTLYRKSIRANIKKSPMHKLLMVQYYVSNAALLSSVIFHMRETTLSRLSDYFTAFLTIMIGLLVSVSRLIFHYSPSFFRAFQVYSIVACLVLFGLHVYKMLFIEFDYKYNKVCCGAMILLTFTFQLILYSKNKHMSHMKYLVYYISIMLVAGGVEIMDQSPVAYLVDTHAVWHMLMTPASFAYLKFVCGDIITHEHYKLE